MSLPPIEASLSYGKLQLDYHDQAELACTVIETANLLDSSPFVTPDLFESTTIGIPLLTSRTSAMSISTSVAKNGATSAKISVNDPDPAQSRTYQLTPTMDTVWAVTIPGSPESIHYANHSNIIDFLSLHLGKIAALDKMLDEVDVHGIDLVRALSTNLPKKPRQNTTSVRYSHNTPNGAHIELHKQTRNRLASYLLLISGIYPVGETTVTKTYWYDVSVRPVREGQEITTQASVIMSSNDLPNSQLDFYIARDQARNTPAASLHQGADILASIAA